MSGKDELNEEITARINELDQKKKAVESLLVELKNKEEEIASQRGEIQYEIARLEELKTENSKMVKTLYERADGLKIREEELAKRESYIKSFCQNIEAFLKG